jgi:hypothetical protein
VRSVTGRVALKKYAAWDTTFPRCFLYSPVNGDDISITNQYIWKTIAMLGNAGGAKKRRNKRKKKEDQGKLDFH